MKNYKNFTYNDDKNELGKTFIISRSIKNIKTNENLEESSIFHLNYIQTKNCNNINYEKNCLILKK
jgi:hypothetical protein